MHEEKSNTMLRGSYRKKYMVFEDPKDPFKDICTLYGGRYVPLPPFSCLSMDAKTFMCNFGCSIVTDNKHLMVSHLVYCHTPEEL